MGARPWFITLYVATNAALFLVALPAVLVFESGAEGFPWRSWLHTGGALILAAGGVAVLGHAARTLAAAGVSPFGVVPGPVLVTDRVYGTVRNPIEIGLIVMALAPWVALDVNLMWSLPLATLVWLLVGVGPYEDRRLLEEFGDDFAEYRSTVGKWVPRRSSTG